MRDPFTRSEYLAPVVPRTLGEAYEALPQVRFLRRVNRAVHDWCTPRWRRVKAKLHAAAKAVLGALAKLCRRFFRWLGNTPPGQAVCRKCRAFCKAVNALPQYQFLCRAHRFFKRHSVARLGFYSAMVSLVALPLCVAYAQPVRAERIYLLVDGDGPRVIMNYPDWEEETAMLRISTTEVGEDAQLILAEGQTVTVLHGEETVTAETRMETVDNLLRRLDIEPTAREMIAINIAGDAPLIHICTELRCQRSERSMSPYKTRSYLNYTLPAGTYEIVQKGQPGYITDTYEDVYRVGRIVQSLLIDRQDDSAVTQIVEYGRLVYSQAQDAKALSAHPFNDGSGGGYLVFEDGTSMLYSKEVVCNATAYYGGTITATGHAVGVGVMAVDPKVFPYGTTMYVGTAGSGRSYYGIATAYDCGGAVKGNIIDVWYPTYADCARWGRRNVTCYVLKTK